jgi:ubiquinone/menaquinone biosynthesis C-methylase UbiE
MARLLDHQEAKAFYDRFGERQDGQAVYEDAATGDLVAHADFPAAHSVFEFGCGTGRFAAGLLADHLPPDATYLGIDVSTTMVDLARARLEPWQDRAEVRLSSGAMGLDVSDAAHDRFVSNFVLDLLAEDDIRRLLDEAHRILKPGGLLCLTGLTDGVTVPARLLGGVWKLVHRLRPQLVGGCRPVVAAAFLDRERWDLRHHASVTRFAISGEIVVAARRR